MSFHPAREGLIPLLKSRCPLPAARDLHLGALGNVMEENNIIWLKRGRGRYGVDAFGHVYSNASGAIKKLRPATNRHGYQQVFLCFGAKDKKRVAVHRLVAEAFLAPDETRPHINHKNGQKIDNRLSNLEWVTAKENAIHAIRAGLYVPPCKLTDQSIARARQLRAKGWKLREIAEDVGCSVTRAHEITMGSTKGLPF